MLRTNNTGKKIQGSQHNVFCLIRKMIVTQLHLPNLMCYQKSMQLSNLVWDFFLPPHFSVFNFSCLKGGFQKWVHHSSWKWKLLISEWQQIQKALFWSPKVCFYKVGKCNRVTYYCITYPSVCWQTAWKICFDILGDFGQIFLIVSKDL